MLENKIVVATETERAMMHEMGFGDNEIVVTGVGIVNAITALGGLPRDVRIINIGYAGSNLIARGEVVTIRNSFLYHPNVTFREPKFILNGAVDCYTSCDFVRRTKFIRPVVFDMELAAICALNFREVISIKIVSDNLSQREYKTFNYDKSWEKTKEELRRVLIQQ